MHVRRYSLIAITGLALMLLMGACGTDDTPTPIVIEVAGTPVVVTATPMPTAQPTSTPEPSQTLVVALASTPELVNCDETGQIYDNWVCHTLYDTLVTQELVQLPNGTRVPGAGFDSSLAESWDYSVSSDKGVTYTFNLRQDAVSPFGNTMTAHDLKWSADRMFASGRVGNFIFRVAAVKQEDIIVVDDFTLQVKTDAPNVLTLEAIGTIRTQGPIDSTEAKKHATADDPWAKEWLTKNAAGFGPYKIGNWVPGTEFVYEANPNWWGGEPFFTKIVVRQVPVSSSRAIALLTGAVDVTYELTVDELAEVDKAKGYTTHRFVGASHDSLRMHSDIPPFNNVKVRQAISYAFPYDDILKGVYREEATPMLSVVPDTVPGYIPVWVYNTDVEKAKALLTEAGYPDGFETTLTYNSGSAVMESMAVFTKSALGKIGIDVTIQSQPPSVFKQVLRKHENPFFLETSAALIGNVGYALDLFFRSAANWTDYNNVRVNELIDIGLKELDVEVQNKYWEEAQGIVAEDAPWVFIAHAGIAYASKTDVVDWLWTPGNYTRWQYLKRQ